DTTGDTTGQETEGELSDCIDEDGNTDWDCCAAQDWQPPEHCTPWGPPAPPRFDPASSPRLRPRLV
ncbi:MAG: hypothetical protein KC486_34255, partial [Myxococcales bacterium]|nr:hypothetical protein [Myxococcales bacterium]